jgi:hypothetical protein
MNSYIEKIRVQFQVFHHIYQPAYLTNLIYLYVLIESFKKLIFLIYIYIYIEWIIEFFLCLLKYICFVVLLISTVVIFFYELLVHFAIGFVVSFPARFVCGFSCFLFSHIFFKFLLFSDIYFSIRNDDDQTSDQIIKDIISMEYLSLCYIILVN